jgi:hypothetical protein
MACAGINPSPKPLLRWGSFELNRALSDLTGGTGSPPLPTLPAGNLDDSLGTYVLADVRSLHDWAHDAARLLSSDSAALAALSGCRESDLDSAACRDGFISAFAERAYRHPLDDDDRAELAATFDDGQELSPGFAGGARAVIEVVLQSPDFLYLLELGNGRRDGVATALSGFESAARLAFFLTGSLPDDELRAAAARGELDEGTLADQARRLMGLAAHRQRVTHFYEQLLHFEADDEARQFIEAAAFGAGTYRALLTQPAGDQRAGLLTQAAFLRATSSSTNTNPVRRGVAVLQQILCQNLPTPPPGVIVKPVDVPPGATLREALELATAEPVCRGCHGIINPIGFAFEHYDYLGRYRTTEHDKPIDSSGDLMLDGAAGHFEDALELQQLIAESAAGPACFVQQWSAQAYGRPSPLPSDHCSQNQVLSAFERSDGNLAETLVAIAQSDGFRYRLSSELAP